MREIDVTPTCQVIDQMIVNLEATAQELKRYRMTISEKNDLTYVAEVSNCITSCLGNLRLDLLITRPLRALGIK